jgi:hypothetical protein
LTLLLIAVALSEAADSPGQVWFIPAPLNYATWAQAADQDFPDGDVDGKLAQMAAVGMTTYFFEREDAAFRAKLYPAAGRHGIRLYLRTYGMRTLSATEAAEYPERLFQVPWARQRRLACPSWTRHQMPQLPAIEKLLRADREHLAGVNIDFIRYPDDDPCDCPACAKLYQERLGRERIAKEDLQDEDLSAAYARLRCDVIAGVVRRAREMCDRLGLKLSVSVFINPPSARMLGQDWTGWAREGLVDFVCPMNYTADRAEHAKWLREHVRAMGDGAELWEGVARSWAGGENSPGQALDQSVDVLKEGADGIASFKMSAFNQDDWRLQQALRDERGWRLELAGDRLSVQGPPFGEIALGRSDVRRAVTEEGPASVIVNDGKTVVLAPSAWVRAGLAPVETTAGNEIAVPVVCVNGSEKSVSCRFDLKVPTGWTVRAPEEPLPVAPGERRPVACRVLVPRDAKAGDYWLEIDAASAETGLFIPRAKPALDAKIDGADCTVTPLTRTHHTSAPTWKRVTVLQKAD